VSGAGGSHRALRVSVAAGAALAMIVWELVVDRWVAATGARPAAALARALAIDAVIGFALALLALAAAERMGFGERMRSRSAATAAVAAAAALFLAALLVPAALLRDAGLSALAPSPAPASGEVDALVAAPVPSRAWVCSAAIDPAPGPGIRARTSAAARTAVLLHLAAWPALWAGLAFAARDRRGGGRRAGRLALAAGVAVVAVAAAALAGAQQSRRAPAPAPSGLAARPACDPGAPVRAYDVSAIDVDLTLNRSGERAPDAAMYALDSAIPAIRAAERESLPGRVSLGLRSDPIQPLAIRASAGDCLVVRFTNRRSGAPAALRVDGLAFAASGADGRALAPDAAARPGEVITYAFVVPDSPDAEQPRPIRDLDEAAAAKGLTGAVIVEPRGATWLDPADGSPLARSSWEAIVAPPDGPAFREFVLVHGAVGGNPVLNYRAERVSGRYVAAGTHPPLAFSSYTYGDPATPVLRSYLGEPTKLRIVHGGGREVHVHRLLGGAIRWVHRPKVGPPRVAFGLHEGVSPGHKMIRSDAQALDPGKAFQADVDCGAGGCAEGPGDFLVLCEAEGHADAGEWGLWRVFDTLQPGLAPLPGRSAPPVAVPSTGLVGRVLDGKRVVPGRALRDPRAETALEALVEAQLPPAGERLDPLDASVWDWARVDARAGPLYVGEPEARDATPNFRPDSPGVRPPILFNPLTGRYAWPLFRPHPGERPPFPGAGHGGAPWLGPYATAAHPGGVCPDRELDPAPPDRKRHVASIARVAGDLLRGLSPPVIVSADRHDCIEVLLSNDADPADRAASARPDVHTHAVRSDPQASSGVAAGLSYSQHAEPWRAAGRALADLAPAGTAEIALTHTRGLRQGVWIAIGLGEGRCPPAAAPFGDPDPGAPPPDREPCTEIRRVRAVTGRGVALDAPLAHEHAAGAAVDTEFVRFLWYAPSEFTAPLSSEPAARAGPRSSSRSR
jgi:manganese oxidase